MPEKNALSRQELYQLVWTQPASSLAKELGISDVALGKWCKKFNIPRPGRGYWQKLAAGHEPDRPILPELGPSGQLTLQRIYPEKKALAERKLPDYEEFEQAPANRVKVLLKLTSPHPLIAKAREVLLGREPDYRTGRLEPGHGVCLDMRVTPDSLNRALRIMDALIKALETRGMGVSVEPLKHYHLTYVRLRGYRIPIDLYEATRKGVVQVDWSDRLVPGLIPTGKLVLRICSEHWGTVKEWRETPRQKLEHCLNRFIVGLHDEAIKLHERDLEHEQRRIQDAERRLKAEEQKRLRELEAARISELDLLLASWRKAADIRELLSALNDAHHVAGVIVEGSELADWMTWAASYADKIDPLKSKKSPP